MVVSPCKSRRKKAKSNQKSSRRFKAQASPRRKGINQNLEGLDEELMGDNQIYEDAEE